MSTWRRHRAHRNNRASSMAPPGEEGWTIRDHRAILHSEPYASADLGAASDVDGQVLTVRGCVGLFAEPDLTPTSGWRHLIDAGAKRPWPTPSPQTPDKAGHKARAPGRFSRFSAGSAALRRSRQDRCAPFMRTFSQPPTPLPPQTRACAIDALGSSPDRFAQCLFGYPLLFRQRVGGTQGFLQRFPSVALYR